MTLPDAVLDQIITCNRFDFGYKQMFYCLKDLLIQQYGTFDGYDHQHFWKYRHYWAQFYHYDMKWDYYEGTPPQEWKQHLYDKWCETDRDPNDFIQMSERDDDMRIIWSDDAMVRCVSEHRHILERYLVRGETRSVVLHRPIDEFFYRAFATDRHGEIIKHSDRFFFLAAQCTSAMHTVGDEKPAKGIQPFTEFKAFTRWLHSNQGGLYDELKANLAKQRSLAPTNIAAQVPKG